MKTFKEFIKEQEDIEKIVDALTEEELDILLNTENLEELDEGIKSKIAALGVAAAVALGASGGAHANTHELKTGGVQPQTSQSVVHKKLDLNQTPTHLNAKKIVKPGTSQVNHGSNVVANHVNHIGG